jgi:multidrug efflux system outer membrane protein
MIRRAPFLLAGLLLGACTLIPGFTPPAPPIPAELPVGEDAAPADAPEAQTIGWQEFFPAPPLQAIIRTALANNRDLRAAMLNVEATRALYRVQRSFIMPGVTANGTENRRAIPEALGGANPLARAGGTRLITQYEANLASTVFELDLFGRIRSLSESALQDYFATEAARDAAQITLVAEVANTYLQWLADRKILILSRDTLAAQEKSLELIAASNEKGVASQLDVAQVRTAVESARANVALYDRLVEQDRNALFLLLGTHDEALLAPEVTLDSVTVMESLPVGVSSHVLLARPDVRQAEHRLLAANADIGAARAAFFPTVSLTGSYGFASTDLSTLFSGGAAGAWSFVPQATLPLFLGGRNFANLDFSEASRDAAVAQYEGAIQAAFREVADELAARRTLDDQLAAQRALVAAAQQAYDLSYARYREGLDSFLTVLDAQRSLFVAQQNEITIDRQRRTNLANLYKALGGGLREESTQSDGTDETVSAGDSK